MLGSYLDSFPGENHAADTARPGGFRHPISDIGGVAGDRDHIACRIQKLESELLVILDRISGAGA